MGPMMAKHINAAFRLYPILTAAARISEKKQTLDVWAETFEISETVGRERAIKVVQKLLLMQED
jgi:hypothetical protein